MPLKPENLQTEGQQNRRYECERLLGFVLGLLQVLIQDEYIINEKGAEG